MMPADCSKTIAVVQLHAGCDMDCRFCVTDERLQTMTVEQYQALLPLLHARGFANIVLGGGEPFQWPHGLATAARLAKEQRFLVQVGTNGIAMPDDDAWPQWVDRYVLPLDGATREAHNRLRCMRGGRDHHAFMLRRFEQMRLYNRSVTASTVVNRENVEQITAIGDWLADYVANGGKLHAWHLYRFIPDGRGGRRHAAQLNLQEHEFDDAVRRAREQSYPFTIFKRPNMRHSATVDFFWYESGKLQIGSRYWRQDAAQSAAATSSPE